MRLPSKPAVLAGLLGAAGLLSVAQEAAKPSLSARELFYSPDEPTTPTPSKAAVTAPGAHQHVTVRPGKKPLSATTSANTQSSSVAAGTADNSQVQTASPTVGSGAVHTNVRTSAGSDVKLASASNRTYPALGLRYSIDQVHDGSKQAVDADTVFHSNDQIDINVEVNAPGYLYVVSRGASGRWTTLFPASDAEQSAALVEPHHSYTIPPGQVIAFSEPSGKEELFLFLSRQPVHSSEDLMLQLSNRNAPSSPATTEAKNLPHYDAVEAFNRMDDAGIRQLRDEYSRDLIVEKMHGGEASSAPTSSNTGSAPAADSSVYVVDPSGRADAHVVADISLRHE